MNLDNFIVRPKRRLIEKYAKPEAWAELPPDAIGELGHEVAGLLYESPFTDVTPRGPDGIFTTPQVRDLLATLDEVRSAALAA